MKVVSFKKVITCQVGDDLAGYGAGITSVAKHDDLYMRGLCMDDGTQKVVMISFDLLGLDEDQDAMIRRIFHEETGIPEVNVILSCTHTHSGPHARKINRPGMFNERYMNELYAWVRETAKELSCAEFRETDVFFYGRHCPENINRRVVALEDNTCRGLPEHKELLPIADGICDDELGILGFYDTEARQFTDVLVNFTAHPLATHVPYMKAGHSISADYPGYLRDFVERESGIPCTFFNGAAGDMFPKEYEQGFEAAEKLGTTLGKAALECMVNMVRNRARCQIREPKLQTRMIEVPVRVGDPTGRNCNRPKAGKPVIREQLHLLTIGDDVCFVGVPGEMLTELGLMIKWSSPYKKTFILYLSTDNVGYICHPNAYIAGGYESTKSLVDTMAGFKMVEAVVKNLYEMKGGDTALQVTDIEM
ncbi:MAG: hypothetical protein J6S54_04200 [Lentisphaeria bacterium]|nr:hypothetical protein [Lentisphaeria bacterium]